MTFLEVLKYAGAIITIIVGLVALVALPAVAAHAENGATPWIHVRVRRQVVGFGWGNSIGISDSQSIFMG